MLTVPVSVCVGGGKLYCVLFQELCVLYLAVYINGDKVNAVNGVGLVVCLAGIILHVVLKAVYGMYPSK